VKTFVEERRCGWDKVGWVVNAWSTEKENICALSENRTPLTMQNLRRNNHQKDPNESQMAHRKAYI
jgi:hypothetical protein